MSLRYLLFDRLFLPQPFQTSWRPRISDGDFISPQAFGRNTFTDEEVGMAIGVIRDARDGQTIATFRELQSRGFEPGNVNITLGIRCLELAQRDWWANHGPCPVVGQWEVLYVMWLYDPTWYEKNQNILIPIWPPLKGYLGTRGMLLAVKEIAEARDLNNPVLLAHPEHLQRAFFIACKIFGKPVAVDTDLEESLNHNFDERSVQKWTRGPWAWLRYEMMARFRHRLNHWI
jgi:hypothetical protein